MGHRSWLVEVKNVTELKKVVDFVAKADDVCGYTTFAEVEVFFKYDDKLWVGFCSDGTRCGQIFRKLVHPKGRGFGLLGEGIEPEDVAYLTQGKFINLLKPKATKEQRQKLSSFLRAAAKKRSKAIEKVMG